MSDRADQLTAFVEEGGWGGASRKAVAGDASRRRYERLTMPDSRTAILMDAPPESGEDVRPFVQIATFLRREGLAAPEIYAADEKLGALLLEDLGDDLFARVLAGSSSIEPTLYEAATDVLVALRLTTPPDLTTYDSVQMADLASLAVEWYARGLREEAAAVDRVPFGAALTPHFLQLETDNAVIILRDYHAENLLWLPNRESVARVGLLDFQDAQLGHPTYDLVSVLQDARRDVPEDIVRFALTHYQKQTGDDPADLAQSYALLGLQRNLRILGVFARLCLRDGKPHYVDLIPRVWRHIETNLAALGDESLSRLITEALPTPTTDRLATLISKCAQIPAQ